MRRVVSTDACNSSELLDAVRHRLSCQLPQLERCHSRDGLETFQCSNESTRCETYRMRARPRICPFAVASTKSHLYVLEAILTLKQQSQHLLQRMEGQIPWEAHSDGRRKLSTAIMGSRKPDPLPNIEKSLQPVSRFTALSCDQPGKLQSSGWMLRWSRERTRNRTPHGCSVPRN